VTTCNVLPICILVFAWVQLQSLFFTPKSFAFYNGWVSSCHWFEPFWIRHQIDQFNYIKFSLRILHLQHPHMQYNLLVETPSLCVQMWRNDAKTCSNLPWKSTSTTGIQNITTSLLVWFELRQADSFEHWLAYVFSQICILNNFQPPKKLRTADLTSYSMRQCRVSFKQGRMKVGGPHVLPNAAWLDVNIHVGLCGSLNVILFQKEPITTHCQHTCCVQLTCSKQHWHMLNDVYTYVYAYVECFWSCGHCEVLYMFHVSPFSA